MFMLSWNIRGIDNRCTFRNLKNLLLEKKKKKKPNIVFLAKTHMTVIQMGGLVRRLGMGGVVCVPR